MIAYHKGEIPFVIYLLPFMAGIGLGLLFCPAAYYTCFAVLFGLLLAIFVVLNLGYARLRLYKHAWTGGIILHVLLLLAGLLSAIKCDSRHSRIYFEKIKADRLLITIVTEPQFKNGYLRFIGEVKQGILKKDMHPATGKLLVTMPCDSVNAISYNYGDVLLIPAKYNQVDAPFNPGEFNYKQYLAHQDIYAQAFLLQKQAITVAHKNANTIIDYALQQRRKLITCFKENMHSTEAIAVASTLILGYKTELSDDVIQAYAKTGTIHILSVSGGHVIILFAFIAFVLGFMDRWRGGRIIKAAVAILLIGYYAVLTGLSPAVCRAALMIGMVTIGKTCNRHINTLNILALSAFVLLLINPYFITDAGFQLSYLAVAGLVVFQPVIYNLLEINNKYLDWLWKFCAAAISAQVMAFPLSAYYFHQFPVYFLLSNLFILPLAELIMYAGIGCLLTAKFGAGFLAGWLGAVLEKTILLMDKGLNVIEHYPYASIGRIWITPVKCLMITAVLLLILALCHYKKTVVLRWVLLMSLGLSVSLIVKDIRSAQTNGITFLNLKKHIGIIFRQGNKAVLLTDIADTDKVYRYSVQPGLDSCHINKLIACRLRQNIKTPWLCKRGNLIRFLNTDVLIYNSSLQHIKLKQGEKLQADIIYAIANHNINLRLVNADYSYQKLIASAAGTRRNLTLIKMQADSLHQKIIMPGRNYSIFFKSN